MSQETRTAEENGASTGATNPSLAASPSDAQQDVTASGGPSATTPRRRGADYYDTILWRVRPSETPVGEGFSLAITSCGRRSGVSTVAANLAIRAADHRLTPTLLVDANLAHPRVDRSFRLYDAPGLANVWAQDCDLSDAIHASGVEGLSVMPLGDQGLIDRTRVDHESLSSLLAELRNDYATIIFDLPDVRQLRHSLLIAQQVDAALLVMRSEVTRRKVAQATVSRLGADGVKVVGTVVTQQKSYIPRWFQRWL